MEATPVNQTNGHTVQETAIPVEDKPRIQNPKVTASTASFDACLNPLSHYVTGDCPGVSEWIDKQQEMTSRCLRFVESVFRTFGALIFVNNVWSGGLFFLACMIHNQFSTLVGVLGIVVAYCTGLLLNVPGSRLRSGVATFNGFMVASFVAATALPFAGIVWNPWLLFPALFFSIVSTVIKSALHSVLQTVQLPALNLPFSLTTLCFLASQGSTLSPLFPAQMAPVHVSTANRSYDAYQGPEIIRGIFFAISNIYGCDNIASVCLAWLAVLVASPLLFVMCLVGSCTGTGIAIVLGVSSQQLASGMWSFNSLLVCGSVGGFFYVWNAFTCALAIFAAAFACVVAGTLYHILGVMSLPFQALPLFITDAIFLLALSAYKPRWFIRVAFSEIRFPEQHRQAYLTNRKVKDNPGPTRRNSQETHVHNA